MGAAEQKQQVANRTIYPDSPPKNLDTFECLVARVDIR